MEPAKIDWKNIDSRFVKDELYEHIKAPQWLDFLAPHDSVDDDAWFCRPDCKHPKTVGDFLKSTPTSKKLSCSSNVSETGPLSDRNQRDTNLKRRGLTQPNNSPKFTEDCENQNPNLSTPVNLQSKSMKSAIKSSTEKKQPINETLQNEDVPRLKSTLSARNLFAGREILNQITEFCNDLKKMAMRTRERENVEKLDVKKIQEEVKEEEEEVVKEGSGGVSREVDVKEKERKPLPEVGKEKSEGVEKESFKEKQRRKKRVDEAENVPISLDLENVKRKGPESLLQVRTNPPSPQCFSATRGPGKTTPLKASRSRPTERGILQEMKPNKEVKKEEPAEKSRTVSIVDGREAKALDVFWFLKPCTLAAT